MRGAVSRTSAAPAVMAAAAAGAVLTLVVIFVPRLHFAYRSTAGHLGLENLDGAIAALVAILFHGRYRRGSAQRDLLVSWAFTVLAGCGFMLALLPVVSSHPSVAVTTWVPLVLRLYAATLIAAAAAGARVRTVRPDQARRLLVAAVLLLVVAVGVGIALSHTLSNPLDPDVSPEASGHPRLVGHPVILVAQGVHAALYGYAALAFTVAASRAGDDLTRWLAVGCTFAAFSRINYLLFPSLYSQWLYSGDFLRTAFYVALGVGAVRELLSYWSLQAEAAVFAERRRLARDLHDGTVQELGYIRTLAHRARHDALDPAAAERIASAAERAIAEARQAIAALSYPLDEPLVDAVRRAAGEIGDRYDVDVAVEAEGRVDVDREHRETMVRIVREAVSNAARHGHPRHIRVRLGRGWLEILDDGRGFDVEQPSPDGFGLVSIRERAESMGAALRISSRAGSGTTVRMVWDGARH